MKFLLKKNNVKKKLVAEKFYKSFNKCFYFYITATKNNWAIRFFSLSGGLIIEFTARNLFSVRRERRAKDSFDFLLFFFFKKFAKEFRVWKNLSPGCRLRLYGYRLLNKHFIRSISYYLRRIKMPLLGLQDCTPFSFNGCRVRKKKR